MKVAIVIAFVFIIGALAVAGAAMLRRGGSRPGTMMRALAWRIGLSVLLFVCVLLAYRFGWIRPTGLPLGV